MRNVEQAMVKAMRKRLNFSSANTTVQWLGDDGLYCEVRLHGHKVGTYYDGAAGWVLSLRDCGFQTMTTKSRINAMLEGVVPGRVKVYQMEGVWYVQHGTQGVHRWEGGANKFDADAPLVD